MVPLIAGDQRVIAPWLSCDECWKKLNQADPVNRSKRTAVGFMLKEQLQAFGPDVCKTTFGKNLGEGLYEFRLKEDELLTSEGPRDVLYRIFFAAYGDQLILLLHAYDKGERPQAFYQERMIQIARQHLRDFRERRRS